MRKATDEANCVLCDAELFEWLYLIGIGLEQLCFISGSSFFPVFSFFAFLPGTLITAVLRSTLFSSLHTASILRIPRIAFLSARQLNAL